MCWYKTSNGNPVADPGFPQNLFSQIFLKTGWKWKKLTWRGGGHTSRNSVCKSIIKYQTKKSDEKPVMNKIQLKKRWQHYSLPIVLYCTKVICMEHQLKNWCLILLYFCFQQEYHPQKDVFEFICNYSTRLLWAWQLDCFDDYGILRLWWLFWRKWFANDQTNRALRLSSSNAFRLHTQHCFFCYFYSYKNLQNTYWVTSAMYFSSW